MRMPRQVKEGDEVAAGDVLCDVETDKATMAWENQDEGFVAKILLEAGAQNVPVGTAAVVRSPQQCLLGEAAGRSCCEHVIVQSQRRCEMRPIEMLGF